MEKFLWCFLVILGLATTGCTSIPQGAPAAKFSVHNIFSSRMVLQQGKPVIFSGTATPGQHVRVEFAGKVRYGVADEQGEWQAKFPKMKAGFTAYTARITGANEKDTILLEDLLIGEVWMCSGQSNMQMPVGGGQFWRVNNFQEEMKNANYPYIRLFQVPLYANPFEKISELHGNSTWQVCSTTSVRGFSGTAYFFGRQLFKDLNVPIGLINSSWGGTRIEPWISEDTYNRHNSPHMATILANKRDAASGMLKSEAERLKELQQQAYKRIGDWMNSFYGYAPEKTKAAQAWKNVDFDDSAWNSIALKDTLNGNIGITWYRKQVEIPANMAGKDAVLNLGAIDDCDQVYFNGVQVGETTYKEKFFWSKQRAYPIPANILKAGKAVVAVRVANHYGDGGMMANPNECAIVTADKKLSLALEGNWKSQEEFRVDGKFPGRPEIPTSLSPVVRHQNPSALFNAMIYPWTRVQIAGAIWYQGCSNAGQIDYYPHHKMLIEDWRTWWKNPDMPFILVQLAGFDRHVPKNRLPDDFWMKRPANAPAHYAVTREIQAAMLELPNVGMAVAMDIGDHSDIHPGNKQDVGYRLAMEAERIAYGLRKVSQGPLYKDMTVEGDKIRISFTNACGGLTTTDGKPLTAFAIGDKSGKMVWAKAEIQADNTVLVWSPEIKNPTFARYGWASYRGDINLANKAGFVASPFRTDRPDYLRK